MKCTCYEDVVCGACMTGAVDPVTKEPIPARVWTDSEIRDAFIYDGGEAEYHDPINGARTQRQVMGDIFDRWLTKRDASTPTPDDVREALADTLSKAFGYGPLTKWGESSHTRHMRQRADVIFAEFEVRPRRTTTYTDDVREVAIKRLDEREEYAEQQGHPTFQDEPSAYINGFEDGVEYARKGKDNRT